MDPYLQFRSGNVGELSESTPSEIQPNSSQPNDNADGASGQKKTKDPTQMRNIWGTRDDERLTVNWNKLGQPDDKLATKLSSFIGTIVRDGKNAPLIYKNWHKVPEHYKDHISALVQDEMNERKTLNANLANKGPNDAFGQVMGKEKHGRVRMYGLGVSPSNLWRDTSGHKANQDTTMDVMEAENSELKSKVSHVQHAPNNLTSTSNQATTTSTPLDMAARHQAWSLSSIQDTSLTQVGDIAVLKSIIRPTETVAIGVLKSTDASKEVEGEELGPNYWEVYVQVPIKPNESLIRSYGLVKTVGQAIGAHVAWPAPFVISQVMDASREYLYK
ncbi:uncharacterized protein LOC114290854 [Camellia sinensis]|uniref:uncharacterized protein LOC114290854 n=1 Tax=Camellia sinensis TaxID=4442 RepID=UPI001035C841|nr:uncharacterized protein LOC114290854 [Camellia sinensis]